MKKSTLLRFGLSLALGLGLQLGTTRAYGGIGKRPTGAPLTKVEFGSLAPLVTESGFVTLSTDGLGTTASQGLIQVDKPVGATVRRAFLLSASTGFTGYRIPNGGVSIDGIPVNWGIETASSIASYNYWAEVTAIVKPIVDAAPPGIMDLQIGEQNSYNIDGEILAVIFDDPNKTAVSTIVLLFGAQSVGGDTFHVTLADPIDLSTPGFILDMALGISFGHQPAGQYSIINVNGQRLSTSAGGEDDGQAANGALLTVGGIGDSDSNPPNPYATDGGGPRYDDELYDLKPFVKNGDTTITVFTQNPSTDDNIFFASFVLSGGAVVNEGILLSPPYAENPVGTQHTVIATVLNDAGNPVPNRLVEFEISAGPDAGLVASGTTDANGKVSWTFKGTAAGVDEISASFVNSKGEVVYSNTVLKKWIETCQPPTAASVPSTKVSNNPRYYREITGKSSCHTPAELKLYVGDTMTASFVAGPFKSGDILRISAGAKATEKPGSYGVASIITVKGQATVWAVDPEGRVGTPIISP